MTDSLHVFPDTNVFLHYPPLSQIDWPTLCGASQVQLVICLQVIHELDEKKSDSRLGDRAARAIREIRATSDGGQPLRDGVTLSIFNQELHREDFAAFLSPDSGDDRIVHLARSYLDENPGQEVAVATEDLGMELRCKAGGIPVVHMDAAMRLENPQSELEKKYKEAVVQNQELTNRVPNIDVLVTHAEETPNDKSPVIFEFDRTIGHIDIDRAVANEEREVAGYFSVANDRYRGKVTRYLGDYRTWMEAVQEHQPLAARMFEFAIYIQNVGRGPGTDVDIHLLFPPRLQFMAGDDERQGEVPPLQSQPKRPNPKDDLMMGIGGRPFDMVSNFKMPKITPIGHPWDKIQGDESSGFVIRIVVPKLNHHAPPEKFGPYWTMFRSWDDAKPFEVTGTLVCRENPRKIDLRIPIIVKVIGT